MISNRTRPVRRVSLLAMLVITVVAALATGSSAAQAMPLDGGTSTSPWIQSDNLDYAPGATVTLSGGNWQPGENVHILVDDTNGHTWSHSADVTADDAGGIQDVFDLPTSFISAYDVTATGDVSGIATTTFTDGNVNVKTVGVGSAQVSWTLFGSNNCSGSAGTSGSISATSLNNGTAIPGGVGAGQSLQLTAGAVSGATFSAWSSGNFTTGNPSTANPVCLIGANGGQNITVMYSSVAATTLAVTSATGTFAGTVNLSATLTASGPGVSGKTVTLSLNGNPVCGGSTGTTCPTTNASGVATLNNVSLAGVNAGTFANVIGASFAGDGTFAASSGSASLTVNKASSTTVVTCPVGVTYTGSAQTPCSASVTGAGGLSQPVSVTYSANTNAGTATASAIFAGDGNHNGSTDSKTFTIATASSTTVVTCPVSVTFDGSAQTPCSASVTGAGGLSQPVSVTYSANTNAGTATASAIFAGDGNHNGSTDSKTFSIDKAASTTTVSCPVSVTYSGSAKTPCSANVAGAGGLSQSLSVTYSDNTNAGTATAGASFAGDTNHESSSDSTTFVIEKTDASVSVSWTDPQTYDGDPHSASGSVSGVGSPAEDLGTPDFTYYSGLDATGTPLAGAPKDAGTYTVLAGFAGNGNYNSASATKTITIDKASSTTVVSCPASVTYSGSAKTPCSANVMGAGGLDESVVVTYSDNTDAGTATASAGYGGDANHKPSSDSTTFVIERADATVTITWDDPQTYTGNPHPASAVVDGVGGETGLSPAAALTYYSGSDTAGTPLAGAPADAGTYTVLAGFAGNGNYNSASATKTITIDKASSTTVVSCPTSVTFNGSAQEPCSAGVTGAGGLNESLLVTYSDNTNAGTATAGASFAGDANHKPSSDSKTFTIDQADSTTAVTCPVSVTYNGSAQEPCSAEVTGAGGLDESVVVTYSDNTDAGTATASASYGGDANHKPSGDSKTFTIDQADSTTAVTCPVSVTYNGSAQEPCSANVKGAGGLDQSVAVSYSNNTSAGTATASATFGGDANHRPSSDSETFAITRATPTVTASWAGWTFDRTAHPADGSVTGVGSPGANLGAPDSFSYYGGSNATGTPLPGAPKDAGTYTVVAHFAGNGNYTAADSAEKTVTVAKADASVSITWADPQIYNGNPHTAGSSVSGVGSPVEDLGSAALTYYAGSTASGAPLAGAPVAAGTYTVNSSFGGNDNYNPVSATKTITIGKAELAVKADDKTKVYNGSPFSSFTRSITGFASGDSETAISGVVTFNGSATTATNAGSYTITPDVTGLSAANYTFKPVNGTLQITKAQLTVRADNKAKPFDGLSFTAFTSTITGYVNGENSSVVSGSVTYAGNAVGATGVGTYTITPGTGGLTATNYSFTGANGTLTISAWYATGFYDPIGVDSSQFVVSGDAVPTVSATGVWNTAKGGSTVPLKFNLYNATGGTQLTTTSSVQSFDLVKLTNCSGTATDDAVDYFATTGATSLRYDGTGGQFIQNWKTPSVNADSCYRVNVKFADGSAIYSFFKLRK